MILYVENRGIVRVDEADNQYSHNSDYIAEFHFDEEWDGKIKTARFWQNGKKYDQILVDDMCDMPPLDKGFVIVGVFTDDMTSGYANTYLKTSIKDFGGNPVEPPEDVYAQLTALIESGMLKGKDGLTPYVGSNNNWWIGDVDTGILARGYTPVKGVDYFTEEEIQQIQNEVSESIQANINHLEINKADKSELDKTNLSLDALWKLNKGQTYDVLEQESEAYSVDVPSGVKYVGIDKVGGKSVVWSQLVCSEATVFGGTLDVDGGVYTLTPNISSDYSHVRFYNFLPYTRKSGHKYYVSIETKSDAWASDGNVAFCTYDGLWLKSFMTSIDPSNYSWQKLKGIFTSNADAAGNGDFSFRKYYEETNSPVSVKNAMVFDLTQMFGAGNEPTIEEFEAMFPADYYPYSKPTIISSQTDRVDVRGKNLFDKASMLDGYYDSSTGKFFANSSVKATPKFKLNPSTNYVLSVNEKGISGYLYEWRGDDYIGRRQIPSTGVFTTSADITLIAIALFDASASSIPVGALIQLEEGSVVTEYSPYSLKQITTGFPVLNFNDYIDLNGKKLHRRTEIYTFSGNEKFVNADSGKFYLDKSEDLSLRIANLTVDNSKNIYILSDKLPSYSWFDLISKGLGIAIRSDGGRNYIRIVNTNLTSLEELAEFCKGMSVAIISEEIITDITIPTELTDWLEVEVGGSVTFHNTDEGKRLLIPNKLSFVRKLDEVTV